MEKKNTMLTAQGINAIANKALKIDVQAIAKAIQTASKSTWDIAYHLDRILKTESFKEDFEKAENLYEFLGMKKSNATQYVKAYRFMVEHGQIAYNKDRTPKTGEIKGTIALVYLLYGLEQSDEFEEFEKWFTANNADITVYDLTVSALKQSIADFHEWKNPTDTKPEKAGKAEAEEKADKVTIMSKDEAIEKVKALLDEANAIMAEYNITVEDLAEEKEPKTKKRGKAKK